MGCCSSTTSQVSPQYPPQPQTEVTGKDARIDGNNNQVKTIQGSTDHDDTFRIRQFDPNELDRQSLDSVRTGKSLVFPNHGDIEVLTCTPPRPETYVKMEDTFWSKKRQLIPDYAVMEKIDAHVLEVSHGME